MIEQLKSQHAMYTNLAEEFLNKWKFSRSEYDLKMEMIYRGAAHAAMRILEEKTIKQ